MKLRTASLIWAALLTASVQVGTSIGAWANHNWGCWHYANATINVYNGGTGPYYDHFQTKIWTHTKSWDSYTDLVLVQSNNAGSNDFINCYAGSYGSTGWLGIAEILNYSGCTVIEGRARLNKSYLNSGYTKKNKRHVACQEVGHLFGLDHQAAQTCMNDAILNVPRPNTHDRDLVNSMY